MVKRCVVGGCSNVPSPGIALHNWPTDKYMAGKWNGFIKSTRSDFKGHHKAPVVCSEHFTVSLLVLQHFLSFRFCHLMQYSEMCVSFRVDTSTQVLGLG